MNHTYTNALISEKSPYLLQHAHNPVQWLPWGEEAFERAAREDKPVFLSIGYSTCHWCHVMERESFENEDIADILNTYFISIKVDREERPDIDAMYMAVCQAMTGSGGWPLSVFLTPEKKPFFVGTYFANESRYGRAGFPQILESLRQVWQNERPRVDETGEAIITQLQEHAKRDVVTPLAPGIEMRTFTLFSEAFDALHGGFNERPKFPSPQNFLFLLRYYSQTHNREALHMVEKTLGEMRNGGIYDHIGFGFHRYSTDRTWLLPHFEKMLYDQALVTVAYTEAYLITRSELYRQTVDEVFTYVLRDLTSPDGGFYSAEDADSEGVEGKFYVWTKEEIAAALPSTDARVFCETYNISAEGNFEEESTGIRTGENIPHLKRVLSELSTNPDPSGADVKKRLESIRSELFNIRELREHPHKDDKILTDWNGLMIAALAVGGRALQQARYIEAAERAWNFINSSMRRADGRLLHRFWRGDAAVSGFLDDYAFLAWGAWELYQSTHNVVYLDAVNTLCEEIIRLFYRDNGALEFSAADNESLPLISADGYDGAIPSGNSVAAYVLTKLGKTLTNDKFIGCAERIIGAFGQQIMQYPLGFSHMMNAHMFLTGDTQEIVIAGSRTDKRTLEMLELLADAYLPNAIVILNDGNEKLHSLAEQTKYQTTVDNRATAYICKNFACQQPITDIEEFKRAIREL